MANNKNQHYVMQFHLRKFASDADKKTVCTYVIDKEIFIDYAPIRGQASRSYFYGNSDELEDIIRFYEDPYSKVANNIIEKNKLPSNSLQRLTLYNYIAFQLSRTPQAKAHFSLAQKETLNGILKLLKDNNLIDDDAEATIEYKEPSMAIWDTINQSMSLSMGFFDLKMKLIKNESKIQFITSDAPVILHNMWTEDTDNGVSTRGIACKGIIVIFTISPRQMILLYDDSIYDVFGKNDCIVTSSDSDIININKFYYETAESTLYFTGDKMTKDSILKNKVNRLKNEPVMRMAMDGVVQVSMPRLTTRMKLTFLKVNFRKAKFKPEDKLFKFRNASLSLIEFYKEMNNSKLDIKKCAHFLNVSTDYMMKLLDEKQILSEGVGALRRVKMQDLLAYKHQRDKDRNAALTHVMRLTEEFGGYDDLEKKSQ